MSIDLIHIFFFAPYVIIVIIAIMYISHKRQSIDTKDIKILELNNEINRIRNESEWRSEIQSQGKFWQTYLMIQVNRKLSTLMGLIL